MPLTPTILTRIVLAASAFQVKNAPDRLPVAEGRGADFLASHSVPSAHQQLGKGIVEQE
jgi:hypothetical protein